MNLFICEQACRTLPSDGAQSSTNFRSDIVLRALLADIRLMDEVRVTIVRDRRTESGDTLCAHPDHHAGCTVLSLDAGEDDSDSNTEALINDCINKADVVWPLAPESNGLLEAISKDVQRHAKILLGCTPQAIHLSGSKYRTSQALQVADIAVVPTYRADSVVPPDHGAWVVKPDDGAGCSDTHIFSTLRTAREWIIAQSCSTSLLNMSMASNYVLQPYLSGRPFSLSLLCGTDEVFLLGCNDQHMVVSDNQFHYMGCTVNSMKDTCGQLARLARKVTTAIPGIWGYVGIDLVMTEHGPVVLEVNPRVTMSHGGLHASIGMNPARMLLDVLHRGHCDIRPFSSHRQINVDINGGRPRQAAALSLN